jgi:lipopolysaccharide heptosyltransferase I
LRLLIVKMSSIGDVVQALCVLEPLRPLCSHLGWMVEPPSLPLLEGHPLIDRVHVFPKARLKEGLRAPLSGGLGAALSGLRRELTSERYDAVLDMQGLFKSAVVVRLSGARRRVGFGGTRELSYLALNERVAPGKKERHAVLKYLDLARHLGGEIERVSFPVPVRPEEEQRVQRLVAELAGEGGPLVVLSPQTRWETKLWPAERFARLAALLLREGARVVLCGAPEDRPILDAISRQAGGEVPNLAGQLNLREFAHLCRLASVVVSCDSGPMHLAAAAEAPVVALFGPTAPWRTGPFGALHRVVRKGLTCSPCFRKSCPSAACMADIDVAEVLEAARGFIDRSSDGGPDQNSHRDLGR